MVQHNRRQFIKASGVGLGVSMIAGCLGDDDNGVDDDDDDVGDDSDDVGDDSDDDTEMTLEERAREEGELTFYFVGGESDAREVLFPAFEEAYPWVADEADLGVVSMPPPEISSRMLSEYQAGQVEADCAVNGFSPMSPLEPEGVFREPDADSELMDIVADYENEWDWRAPYAMPNHVTPITTTLNADEVDDDNYPETYEDWTDDHWEDRIAMDQPSLLNIAGGHWATLYPEMDESDWDDMMQGIADNNPRLSASITETFRQLATGEAEMALILINDYISTRDDPEIPDLEIVWANEPITYTIGAGYLATDAPNPNMGELFIQWMASEDGQEAVAETGRVTPHEGVKEEYFGDIIPDDAELVPQAYNNDDFWENPDAWVDRFEGFGL